MRVILQRSKEACVKVSGDFVGSIDRGIVLLVGFTDGDGDFEIDYMVDKIINLRIFDDEFGVMNKSLVDVKGSVLSVSQFTLYADTRKGRRPSYVKALASDKASLLYDKFNEKLRNSGVFVASGVFGADMEVSLTNDGPVTIVLERESGNE